MDLGIYESREGHRRDTCDAIIALYVQITREIGLLGWRILVGWDPNSIIP